MATAAVLSPVATSPPVTNVVKNDEVVRHKETVRVSALTNRVINPQKLPKVDIYWCEPCKMKLTNPLASLKHFTGHDHSVAVNKANAATKKTAQASKRKQDPKVSAPPAKVAKGNTVSSSAGSAAAAAKKKPAATPPTKTNASNRGSNRGRGANSRPSFNSRNNFNNNNNNDQRRNFNNGTFNNQRTSNFFQNNNNQRSSNFNSTNNQRSLTFGGFNLSRNNQGDNSYPQSYIRESAGMNRNMGGDNSYTWQQQQQFGAEINNMLAQRQLGNLQQEVSNLEMLQQRLMRAENPAGHGLLSLLHGNNNKNNNNRGGLVRGDGFGGNRSRRDGFWGR